jgi:hypothetical protein
MATIEAAVQSGAMAARALQKVEMREHGKRRISTVPIKMAPHKVFTDTTFLAAKLALLPFAYGAAAWSAARGVAKGEDVGMAAYSPGKYVMLLPYQYVTDWWKTAYWVARGLNGPVEGVDPADVPIGFGRRDIPPSSEGPGAHGKRSEGTGLVSALVDLGASALGALGDALQEISASHRSTEKTAAGHQPASLFTGFVVQALQVVQAACEGNERRSDNGATDQRAYRRRWRVKE